MINLLSGGPGGGKSYEAVVFHVLVAVQEGRKVVTNLALEVDQIALIEPRARDLIELRERTLAVRPDFVSYGERWNDQAFSHVEDYRDSWRDADGRGPLYVIDEAHMSLPRIGTPRVVNEWYGMHRHEGVDVLLITQSHRKIARDVTDLVQCHYRVRKKTMWGQPDRYIRKVQDGVRGADMAETERRYEARFFKLYRSHSKSLVSVVEADAKDVMPSFRKWYRFSAVLLVLAALGAVARLATSSGDAKLARPQRAAAEGPRVSGEGPPKPPVVVVDVKKAPLDGMGVHVSGALRSARGFDYVFVISQGGIAEFTQSRADLELAGYEVRWVNDCIAELRHEFAKPFFVRCDAPTVRIVSAKAEAAVSSASGSPAVEVRQARSSSTSGR
ncbi:MAG: hypothetical protein A3F74_15940 [Betaproteobacteria bacterium RIFCSPLOWO2_12_FULL_62_58]|nr:MAG: hypothetical protein A3I62_04010 [Betaproteobacteria bacterium RIFCSPLOWO2_02_FULL_62_79]OGA51799.1 MAG: hypothetical protein A3F74_15940 [Betaproteobacteria bacterium RIFCSPLOWO2_12_FULL_62_58]